MSLKQSEAESNGTFQCINTNGVCKIQVELCHLIGGKMFLASNHSESILASVFCVVGAFGLARKKVTKKGWDENV